MSKKLFTEKEIKKLSKNKNVLKVSSKSIVYALEFKENLLKNIQKENYPE